MNWESQIILLTKLKIKKINQITVKNWYDVGDIDDLKRARKEISDFDNLPKEDEFIYFNNNKVIKFLWIKNYLKKEY